MSGKKRHVGNAVLGTLTWVYIAILYIPFVIMFVLSFMSKSPSLGFLSYWNCSILDEFVKSQKLSPSREACLRLVSIQKRPFSAISASICGNNCAAHIPTPPHNSLISLTLQKIPHF